jgi:hypothetical protein
MDQRRQGHLVNPSLGAPVDLPLGVAVSLGNEHRATGGSKGDRDPSIVGVLGVGALVFRGACSQAITSSHIWVLLDFQRALARARLESDRQKRQPIEVRAMPDLSCAPRTLRRRRRS